MKGYRVLLLVPALLAAIFLTPPGGILPASGSVPRWVLHVRRFPGGLSNSVRASIAPEVAAARARYGVLPRTARPSVQAGGSNVQMNGDSTPPVPQNETSVAFSLDDPMVAVAGANDWVGAGLAIMRTADGGRSWTTFFDAPAFSTTHRPCFGGDPAVDYSRRDHAFYMATMCFTDVDAPSELHVWKSVDGGRTWTPAGLASVPASNVDDNGDVDTSIFLDKEYIVVDNSLASPHYGRIYVTYVKFHILPDGFSDFCPVQLAYTDEIPTNNPAGAVWLHTAVVPDAPGDDGRGPSANQDAYPQVEANGDLDIAYSLEECNTALDSGLRFQKSTDGGASFLLKPVRIDKPGRFKDNPRRDDRLPPTRFRAPLSPSLDVNKRTGTLAYVYQNNLTRETSRADISVQLSHDGGMHWTDMQIISTQDGAPAPNDQFFPWIDSDEAGTFFVIWFDRRLDAANRNIDTFQAVSRDDGASWRNSRLSSASWNPDKGFFGCGCFIGDYIGLAASLQVLYAVWTDGRDSAFDETGLGETDIFTRIQIRR